MTLTGIFGGGKADRQWRRWKRRPLEEWRSICQCQRHQEQRLARRRSFIRIPAALMLGVPLAFGATRLPTDNFIPNAAVIQEPAPARPRNFVTLPPLDEELNMRDVEFRLITPRVRDEFLAHKIVRDTFSMEMVKAEFFRTEIPYGSIIYREARRQGLQPELLAAVVEAESDFRPRLVSNKNAMGLMQIIPSTGELMGGQRDQLFDPDENVRLGAKYLRYLHDRFNGDQRLILAAYNAGETTVRRFGGIPPYPETQNYLLRVARCKQKYQHRVAGRVAELRAMVSAE
jgi:soluble lytic murein transglycosylase-like protein